METKIKIKGMSCNHCKMKIEKTLNSTKGINQAIVDLQGNEATVSYDAQKINDQKIVKLISELGYQASLGNAKNKTKDILAVFGIVIAIYLVVKSTLGFDLLNAIPAVDSSASLSMLFLIGLLTSVHCVSMCGGIMLMATTNQKRSYKNPLLYNLGRLTSYTIIGGVVGLLGSILSISPIFMFVVLTIASIFMFLYGLSMLGLSKFRINVNYPKFKLKSKNPYIIGLLNGLMPCGPLQAMQLYAIGTGSFIIGATSMFLFALGTIPLMFLVGILFTNLKGDKFYYAQLVSAILITLLSLVMFNRALTYIGVDTNQNRYEDAKVAVMKQGYQEVTVNVGYSSYEDIVIEKGVPVKLNFRVEKANLNGCNNGIIINEWGIKKMFEPGDNIVEFTPTQKGNYLYTCWMNMIKNHIIVVDKLEEVK